MTQVWTKAEDRVVLTTRHLATADVARILGRSHSAVANRRMKLGRESGINFRANNDPFSVGKRRLLARTCLHCGLLLESRHFGVDKGNWRSTCVHCRLVRSPQPDRSHGAGSNDYANQRLQSLSLPHAVNKGQPWTGSDHKILSDPDMTNIEKAFKLGRTYFGTVSAVSANGYTSLTGLGDPDKRQWVIDNPNLYLVGAPAGAS